MFWRKKPTVCDYLHLWTTGNTFFLASVTRAWQLKSTLICMKKPKLPSLYEYFRISGRSVACLRWRVTPKSRFGEIRQHLNSRCFACLLLVRIFFWTIAKELTSIQMCIKWNFYCSSFPMIEEVTSATKRSWRDFHIKNLHVEHLHFLQALTTSGERKIKGEQTQNLSLCTCQPAKKNTLSFILSGLDFGGALAAQWWILFLCIVILQAI